jgi:hypothetical protein
MLKWTGAVVVGLCVLIAAPGALAQQDSRKALRQRIERKRQEARERQERLQRERRAKTGEHNINAARKKALKGRLEKRQKHQTRRIEHGTRRGYLSDAELQKLDAEQKRIGDMALSFKADGKLQRAEVKQLRDALNQASIHIWAEKHDTESNQMPVYRLGKTVFAKDELTGVLQQDDLSGAEARQLATDFRRTLHLKRRLATDDLTEEQRKVLQAEFNDLLNKYFETREPVTAE